MVDGVDTPSKLGRLPNMVETMALIEDTVGLTQKKTLGSLVRGGGVTILVDGVTVLVISRLRLSVVKDTMESVVDEVSPSISKGRATSPNVCLSKSKYEKGGGDTLCLLGEGGGGG